MKRILTTLLAFFAITSAAYCAEPSQKAVELYNSGIDLYQTGEVQKSIEAFNEAIKLAPDFYEAYYNLGQIQTSTNKLDDAIKTYTKIYNMRPSDDENLYSLASILYKRGYLAKASGFYHKIPSSSSYYKEAQKDLSKLVQRQKELKEEAEAKALAATQRLNTAQKSITKAPEITVVQPKTVVETKVAPRVEPTAEIKTIQQITSVPNPVPSIPSKVMTYEGVSAPSGVAMDSKGNVYIASFSENVIYKIDTQGEKKVFADSAILSGPVGIALDSWDNLYVANYTKGNITKINQNGDSGILTTVKNPYCLNITNNNLFITEQGTNTVIRYAL